MNKTQHTNWSYFCSVPPSHNENQHYIVPIKKRKVEVPVLAIVFTSDGRRR